MSERFVIPSRGSRISLPSDGRVRRGGLVDLLLVGLTLTALWGRTPVIELGQRAAAWVVGSEHTERSLTDFFLTGPDAEEVMELLATVDATRIGEVGSALPEGALPEPWRTAALLVLADARPGAALPPDVAALPAEQQTEALLDHLYRQDAEAAIERWVLGEDLVDRATRRAELAGIDNAGAYRSHRRFLPSEQRSLADRYVEGALALATVLQMTWPVQGEHRISSPYGERVHPTTGHKRFHNGVDLAVAVGTEILATQDGQVAVSAYDDVNGNYLVLDHGSGVRTSYCHLEQRLVERGETVVRGQHVADSGNTGRSTGPHLHFVLRVGKSTVDPMRMRHTALADRTVDADRTAGEERETSGG